MRVLVVNAANYIGRALLHQLSAAGHNVTGVACEIGGRQARVDGAQIRPAPAETALPGRRPDFDAAYLIAPENGDPSENELAVLARTAHQAALQHVVYLSPLVAPVARLVACRRAVAILREIGLAPTHARCSPVISDGSPAFDLARMLGECFPVLPRTMWMNRQFTPIALPDLLAYAVAITGQADARGATIDFVGGSTETYATMAATYAKLRGLTRAELPLPVNLPRLSNAVLRLVDSQARHDWTTLINADFAKPAEKASAASELFPNIRPVTFADAARIVLDNSRLPALRSQAREPSSAPQHAIIRRSGMIVGIWETLVRAPADEVFGVISSLGGKEGWLFADELWRLRGYIDAFCGGVGVRRTVRPGMRPIGPGDAVDYFRVDRIIPGRLIDLKAEMKMPGRGWLRLESLPLNATTTMLRTAVFFDPLGVAGRVYWTALYPFHVLLFDGLHRAIASAAERRRPAGSGAKRLSAHA